MVIYQLHNLGQNKRIRIKVRVPVDNPVLPSATTLFPAANWMERETFDFYGVVFQGHPNLTRILNVEDMLIPPCGKNTRSKIRVRSDKTINNLDADMTNNQISDPIYHEGEKQYSYLNLGPTGTRPHTVFFKTC